MNKPKLVFFGNERLATGVSSKAPVLRGLIEAGYDITALVVSQADTVSRNKRELEVIEVAKAHNIPVLRPKKAAEIKADLAKLDAQAGILVAFGQIVPQYIIDIFPCGIINIHPSLLPKLRGPTPIETAILAGLEESGVSLMRLSAEMDAGPVYIQKKIQLNGDETKLLLAGKLLDTGSKLLLNQLPAILSGKLQPLAQTGEPSYSQKITKADGQLDFNKSAYKLEAQIRAYAGWPKSRAKIFGKDIIVTKARVAKGENDGSLVMRCRLGYLEIQELTGPSGRSMSGADFIRGYKKD